MYTLTLINAVINTNLVFLSSVIGQVFHRVVFKAAIALYFPEEGRDQVVYLLLVVLPVTILIAYLIQTGYDRGLDAWQQRRARADPIRAPGREKPRYPGGFHQRRSARSGRCHGFGRSVAGGRIGGSVPGPGR